MAGVESSKPPYARMSPDERRKTMFEMDLTEISACDVFLFVLDGRIPDEGACVELGLAYMHRLTTKRKRLIIITDGLPGGLHWLPTKSHATSFFRSNC